MSSTPCWARCRSGPACQLASATSSAPQTKPSESSCADRSARARSPAWWLRGTRCPSAMSDAVIVVVYAVGVILWAAQPNWLTRQSLLSGFVVTLAISGLLGVLSGRWRSLLAPLVFGLTIGVISAATVVGD